MDRSAMEEEILATVQNLRGYRDKLAGDLEEAQARVGELKKGVARIDRILSVAEGRPGRPKSGKPTVVNHKKNGKAAEDRANQIVELMAGHPEKEDWVVSEIAQALAVAPATVNPAVNYAREKGMIRRTPRTVKGGGHAYAPFPT